MYEFERFALSLASQAHPGSAYAKAYRYGDQWLASAISNINSKTSKTPKVAATSNPAVGSIDGHEKWEPLPIDRIQPSYAETIAGLEKAIGEVAADNGFAVEYAPERDNLVAHAQATLESAKAGKVTRRQVADHFVAAGKWLMEKFVGTGIGTAGGELVKWGLRLLGLIP